MVAIAEIPESKKTGGPEQWQGRIALLALCGIAFYLVLRFGLHLTGTLGGVAIQEI
ncbi:MAG: hypothetical protein H7308_01950, partial [Chthonomonadaceae bacterium]|nr:hypothetical protein [Chthonomonadaceae bacterium]